jgi:hypothetical protein
MLSSHALIGNLVRILGFKAYPQKVRKLTIVSHFSKELFGSVHENISFPEVGDCLCASCTVVVDNVGTVVKYAALVSGIGEVNVLMKRMLLVICK